MANWTLVGMGPRCKVARREQGASLPLSLSLFIVIVFVFVFCVCDLYFVFCAWCLCKEARREQEASLFLSFLSVIVIVIVIVFVFVFCVFGGNKEPPPSFSLLLLSAIPVISRLSPRRHASHPRRCSLSEIIAGGASSVQSAQKSWERQQKLSPTLTLKS